MRGSALPRCNKLALQRTKSKSSQIKFAQGWLPGTAWLLEGPAIAGDFYPQLPRKRKSRLPR